MLAALESSVGAQRRLVADASHELRTPLTAARTNVDLLREGKLPEDEARHALDEASVELDALTHLVSDLVELARGEERKLRIEDVQLDDLVAAIVERAQARAPQVRFVTALSPTHVKADPVLLERAVSNLLDNAVKYSPDGAPIEVSVRGGEVVVAGSRPGDRRRGSAARLRPLLPRGDGALEAGRRPRPRDRSRGGRGARRHGERGEHARGRPLQARAADDGLGRRGDDELGDLGRRRADLDADRFERVLLRRAVPDEPEMIAPA